MKLYYLLDQTQQKSLNARGLDYTPAYFGALAAYLGITLHPILPDRLSSLLQDDVLFVGASRMECLPACKLILMGTALASDPIPAQRKRRVFAHYETQTGEMLPLFAPLCKPQTEGKILAYAHTESGEKLPALIQNTHGYEFCFNLLASVWFSGDGFASDTPSDYFFIGRTPDTRPLLDVQNTLPFNDLLLAELERALCELGIPMIWKLPPTDREEIPDLAIHFSGDDDCSSLQYNTDATLTMEERGLPYHINAMPKRGEYFVMNRADFDRLRAHGCEIALHTDFTDGVPYESQSLGAQVALFESCFGIHPLTNTNHCFIQGGSTAERMRYFEAHGILADNGKMGEFDPSDINAFDLCGFGFGTAFPRFTCDDAAHGNKPIGSMEIPIPYYEPRLHSEDADTAKITSYLDRGAERGQYLQFFIHPHYLALQSSKRPAVLRALDCIQNHLAKKGYCVHLCTTNQIARFWKSRSEATLGKTDDAWEISCNASMIVRLPQVCQSVMLDGKQTETVSKTVGGKAVTLIKIPAGTHRFCFS